MLLFINHNILHSLKKQALFVCFFISFTSFFAQNNLVLDSGFDIYKSAYPFNFFDMVYWHGINCSPDIFHKSGSMLSYGIPKNFYGFQDLISDSCYAGLILWSKNYSNGREYIQTKLSKELKKDYTYCIEFYVSLADTSNYSTSAIGGVFSKDSLTNSCFFCRLPIQSSFENDSTNKITSVNWNKITSMYTAQGGEKYFTIGNFREDIEMNNYLSQVKNNSSSHSDYSYCFIENVSVYACDRPLVEEPQDTTFVFIPNVFSPNQDGENDLWEVTANKVNNLNIQVFNRWGEQVYIFNSANLKLDTSTALSVTYNPAWDGYTSTGKPVPEGTYFYIVQYTLPSGETKVEKGYVTLLR